MRITAAALACAIVLPAPTGAQPDAVRTQAQPAAKPVESALDPIQVASVQSARSAILERQRRQTAADLAAVFETIQLSQETIRVLDSEIVALAKDRERIRQAMIEAAAAQKATSKELAATERRVDALASEEGLIKVSLNERRGVLAEVLAALQRMGRKPPPALLVKPRDALGSVRSAILLGAVVPAIREETDRLVADLERLGAVRLAIGAETRRFAGQVVRHREEEARLSRLFAEKEKLEAENRDRLSAEAARAAELAEKATDLKGLIGSLQNEVDRARAAEEAARLAEMRRQADEQAKAAEARRMDEARRMEEERLIREARVIEQRVAETRRLAEARDAEAARGREDIPETVVATAERDAPSVESPVPAAPPSPDDGVGEAESGGEGAVEIAAFAPRDAPSADAAPEYDIASLRREAVRLEPAAAFSTMKGRLSKPVAGKQLIGFGGKDDIGRETTGASFAARPGDAVTAPADGRVLYSGPFRSYGQLLILDAGDGYHVVLAGMERIDVETGQFVSAGEPVAVMGARRLASIATAEFGATQPALYVEFRKDGKPVDPSAWWMDEPSGRTTNDS
ncbi:MAG TPA: peptidoglycan DD-metalloendopeptidase family protein [Aurantimonas sp.]